MTTFSPRLFAFYARRTFESRRWARARDRLTGSPTQRWFSERATREKTIYYVIWSEDRVIFLRDREKTEHREAAGKFLSGPSKLSLPTNAGVTVINELTRRMLRARKD